MGEDGSCVVPLLDLRVEYDPLRERVLAAVDEVLSSGRLYLGPQTEAFEEEFAAYCGASYGVACSSGTDALILALQACGVGPGDEVITVSHTFIATVAAIALVGATPVFVDIHPQTYTMDISQLPAAVTARTKAVLPVHLYGHPVDMGPLLAFTRSRGLTVIEDAAQAHGARERGRPVGGLGDAGCFSFVFTKNLRAYGDAGMLVTSDRAIAERARRLRDHGRSARYEHVEFGWNARIDEVQAAILRLKLPLLDGWIARRRAHARAYDEALGSAGIATPFEAPDVTHVYHQYVVQVDDREAVRAELARRGVETGVHYPIPCHLQEACRGLGYGPGALPVTERCAGRILSLPVYPELTEEQRARVVTSLLEATASKSMEEQRV
ncbi:MAG: erythromycin biosynthesis sensory transduction protein eryC1 [Chloroflexi bacterium RBG_16_68_14]|nr:MAG: erythromycin biosynthesis sensory transduction protein eryC1 [Chloroflexi bacterium RBG_16_68_14]